MGDPKTVLEGTVKYRDRKKWKARWAVVTKLSPVADCLHLQLYRDSKERCKNGPTKASLSLQGFLGMETGFTLDKESNTMALICSELVVVLAFDSRELLIQWQVKIRANLAEEQQFLVQIATIPPKSKLPCGPARLHLLDHTFSLVAGVPPRLLGTWPIKELRRFGVIDGKFCFEGGSLCGKGEGLHVLLTNQSEELAQAMTLASKGKLLGKRKALSRKSSLLETSTRTPVHKISRRSSDKCSTNESSRPLLSSGSEGSTCDACSEIVRSADPLAGCDDSTYNSGSSCAKASSCRIHYRWPSCMSRWGPSSTVTTSDVESVDTVSVTLSDYNGPAHSSDGKKPNESASSFLCLCEGQGTWPLSHCTKCGRQFYSRSSLGHQNAGRQQSKLSPVPHATDCANNFSPQWTMDAALPSPSNEDVSPNSKKVSVYQAMQPLSDRASLCSHTSHSSCASATSSCGSEYSVPRSYLESLYDKPKTLIHVRDSCSSAKNGGIVNSSVTNVQQTSAVRSAVGGHCQDMAEKLIICPCHEPINELMAPEDEKPRPPCSCWNQLSLSMRSEQEFCVTVSSNQKSVSANPSPSSSPKKVQHSTSSATVRANTVSIMSVTKACSCNKSIDNQPNSHYSVPRTALANLYMKEIQGIAGRKTNVKRVIENPLPALPSDDYDVPKKFVDILASSDVSLKSSIKALESDTLCNCSSMKFGTSGSSMKELSQPELIRQQYERSTSESLQICTCQRVMLWAGSFVPCLGGPSKKPTDQGWQCGKRIGYPGNSSRAIPNHYGTICCEPPRTAEVILRDGKTKHILHPQNAPNVSCLLMNRTGESASGNSSNASNVALPSECLQKPDEISELGSDSTAETHTKSSPVKEKEVFDSTVANYENLEFAQSLPLYENSNAVLNRLEEKERTHFYAEKPPLPPRGRTLSAEFSQSPKSKENDDSSKQPCGCQHACKHNSDHPETTDSKWSSSAYELMSFEKQNGSGCDEDYLLMQPVYPGKSMQEQDFCIQPQSEEGTSKSQLPECGESGRDLPLRPFMPFSYPHLESNDDENGSTSTAKASVPGRSHYGDVMSRRCRLINDDVDLRSTRSNSLSELKKIVLLRKRSSSVDGKNSVPVSDYRIQSNPASPLNNPRSLAHKTAHKSSLFAKLNIRSKEKSMSTNEIIPQAGMPSASNFLNNDRRNNLHRSADCLKLNEEYTNSDDDISNDHSEASVKEAATMKRSCSVPCPSSMPENLPSPRENGVSVIPELNDLNKDSSTSSSGNPEEYFGSKSSSPHEKSGGVLVSCAQVDCDKANRHHPCDRCGAKSDAQVTAKRAAGQGFHVTTMENLSVLDPYKSSSSSSSSDMSDFIESLSHCSRSSSSSSGSSSEYMRSEDLYPHKFGNKASFAKGSSGQFVCSAPLHKSQNVCCHISDGDVECRCHNCCSHATYLKHIAECSESGTSAETGFQSDTCNFVTSHDKRSNSSLGALELEESKIVNKSSYPTKSSDPVAIPQPSCYCAMLSGKIVNGSRTARSSRSSSSSSSSFSSSSPSTTDYSSSSSGNCSLPAAVLNISEERDGKERRFGSSRFCKEGSTSKQNANSSESSASRNEVQFRSSVQGGSDRGEGSCM